MPTFNKETIENALENDSNSDILELTSSKIKESKNDILQKLQLDRDKLKYYHQTLKHYRYIENPNNIILGNFIRWINISNPENITLTNGAMACEFKETQSGVYLLCKNHYNQFFKINLEQCLIFQKLNNQEEVLLSVVNYLSK